MAFGLPTISVPWWGMISGLFWTMVAFIGVGGILGYTVYKVREKMVFIYPVTVLRHKENGTVKEVPEYKGGFVNNKSKIRDFKIKHVKQWWKKEILGFTPDLQYADADGRLTFILLGDGKTIQQVKKELVTEETVVEGGKEITYSLLVTPIPTDVKTATINKIHEVRAMMDKSKLTALAIGFASFVILGIVHVIFLYIQHKK